MEGKTNFSRRLKKFDDLAWLTSTVLLYDRSKPLVTLSDHVADKASAVLSTEFT